MFRTRLSALALALPFALTACGPDAPPPVKVMSLTLDENGAYAPRQIELRTVLDVVSMRGYAATLKGGAKIVFDEQELTAHDQATGGLTEEQFRTLILKNPGGAMRASFVEQNGVLWPQDFHTWNLVGTYYNFEKAFEYFHASTEIPLDTLRGADVFYYPDLSWPGLANEDNAYFLPPLKSFVLVGQREAQQVPFPMNPGIVAHEYAHQVFNRLVYDGEAFPYPLIAWGSSGALAGFANPAVNLLKSMDEGFADFHAVQAGCTGKGCSPDFLEASLGTETSNLRDMSQQRCLSAELAEAYFNNTDAVFAASGRPYELGTIFASALYAAGEKTGQRQGLSRALIAAYSDPSAGNPGFAQLITQNRDSPGDFTASKVFDSLVRHVPDVELKHALCVELFDRLGFTGADLPGCPSSAGLAPRACSTGGTEP